MGPAWAWEGGAQGRGSVVPQRGSGSHNWAPIEHSVREAEASWEPLRGWPEAWWADAKLWVSLQMHWGPWTQGEPRGTGGPFRGCMFSRVQSRQTEVTCQMYRFLMCCFFFLTLDTEDFEFIGEVTACIGLILSDAGHQHMLRRSAT